MGKKIKNKGGANNNLILVIFSLVIVIGCLLFIFMHDKIYNKTGSIKTIEVYKN